MINIVTLRGFRVKPTIFGNLIHEDMRLPWIGSKSEKYQYINLSRMQMCYLRDFYMDEDSYSDAIESYIKSSLDSCRKNKEILVVSTLNELDSLIIRAIIKEDSENRGGKIYCFGPDYNSESNQYDLELIDIDKDGRFDNSSKLFETSIKYLDRLL